MWYKTDELSHHGILGMHWGKKNGPPYPIGASDHSASEKKAGWRKSLDGGSSEKAEKKYGKRIQKLEKKAIAKRYKEDRKNGGGFVFKQYRYSTGENYEKAEKDFHKNIKKDATYKDLSSKAFEAEKKRLMSEKPYINDDRKYTRFINSKQYIDLKNASKKATKAKDEYVKQYAKNYIDTIKKAKMKDMGLSDSEHERAKKYISDKFYDFVWDGNLEYNPDSYYGRGIERYKNKYKSK